MAKIEYRQVDDDEYQKYESKAYSLLFKISGYLNKKVSKLKYSDILEYFESNFNILFNFFDEDPIETFGDDSWEKSKPSASWIKHKDVVKNQTFCFLPSDIVDRIAGITVPKGERTLIMINQSCNLQRLIFTILHELCHFYFHILDEKKKKCFVSLSSEPLAGNYPPELLPFEDEANNIASILFCSNERLEHMLIKKYSFKDMCRNTKMSPPAMHNRLLNYFQHNLSMSPYPALNRLWDFRNGKNKVVHWLKRLVEEKQEKIKEQNLNMIASQAEYIDNIQDILNLSVCSCCGHTRTLYVKYCPICGSKNTLPALSSFEVFPKNYIERINRMKYSKIETNENGTPVACPKCEYEYLEEYFNYCPICATYIHNVCLGPDWNRIVDTIDGEVELTIQERNDHNSSCKGNLDGAFRYCPECGSETSYGHQKILTDWEEEKKNIDSPFSQPKFNDSPFR